MQSSAAFSVARVKNDCHVYAASWLRPTCLSGMAFLAFVPQVTQSMLCCSLQMVGTVRYCCWWLMSLYTQSAEYLHMQPSSVPTRIGRSLGRAKLLIILHEK